MRRSIGVLGVLGLGSGCIQTAFPSEQGQLRIETTGVTAGGYRDVSPTLPVLVGTQVCADVCIEVGGQPCDDARRNAAAACFEQRLEGPGVLSAGCVTMAGPGEVAWRFAPTGCDEGGPFGPDQVTYVAVALAEVEARLEFPSEARVLRELAQGPQADGSFLFTTADATGLPDHLFPEVGEPMRIVDEGTAAARVGLFLVDDTPVMWAEAGAEVLVEGATTVSVGPSGAVVQPSGAGGDVRLKTPLGEFRAGAWEVAEEAASMELVGVMLRDGAGQDAPLAARAIVRDAEGAPLFGAPVAWGFDGGPLSVSVPDVGVGDRSYALLDGASCLRPSAREGSFQGVLTARYGALEATVDLAWQNGPALGTPEELIAADAAFTLTESCIGPLGPPEPACGCGTSGPASGAVTAGLAALFALRGRARRR